jgi:UDP-glucose-4-epimerase GalE
MMKILVTGGAGFIGSHTCKLLAKRGHQPIVFDNLSRGHRAAVRYGPLEIGDIGDLPRIRGVLKHHAPDAIMHFAAYAYVGESVNFPLLYYRNNVVGTAALLEALIEFKPIPFVFSSSCATYGIAETGPITENHSQKPINPYGNTKLAVERMLTDVANAHGLPSIALRYFNAAGSDPDLEVGEMHNPETHLIPLVLRAARDQTPITVYGTDYDTPDGTCIRDYVHVMDIAEAHVLALEHLLNGGAGGAINLANAHGYSVMDVIATAKSITKREIIVNYAARRAGDPAVLVGCADRARDLLGWRPSRSEIDLQIGDAWRWVESRTERLMV